MISEGDGNPVVANKKAMFNIFLAKGDGTKLYSSTDQGTPTQVAMNEKEFFKVIIDGLVGKPQGSRVAIAATVKDVWGAAGAPQLKLKTTDTVLFVIDVLSVEPKDVLDAPKGKTVAAPADAPAVKESGGKVTGIDFSKAPKKAPTKLQVIPLVEGDGPEAKAGRLVTFNYYGAVYGHEEALRLLVQPRCPGAVRRRRQGPDPGLGQGDPGSQAGQPRADHRAAGRRVRRAGAVRHPRELDADVRRRRPRCGLLSRTAGLG